MIPVADTIPSKKIPFVNLFFILVNVLVFLYELKLGKNLNNFLLDYGNVPVRFVYWTEFGGQFWDIKRYVPLFSSMFLHGGFFHIIGNMIYLWIFGDNVEDRLGHLGYLFFYVIGGIVSEIIQILSDPHSTLPIIGASGAIATVLGAYFVFYPYSRIITLLPVFGWYSFVEIPALFYLGFWFLMQLFSGTFLLMSPESFASGGVAWWAHAGGFGVGALVGWFIKRFSPTDE
ncbi:rhomboid family intramembrane serine protease [Methylacidiphilum caldifontis]|uniref:Rhomboid family intramembrane serine protease n=1 Tax=Methylacidiphilum caldifontis TaxID=2795386 RepID=A0A4Y8PGR9_9BACT|nr:rhomboid family intramembrane serine protease [Methylacidiphilum caldifontis]TFE71556.1 rhomboid family intramembrane serine protease [Methylacidiphilum caldifontis]